MSSSNVKAHRAAHESWARRDFDGAVHGMAKDFAFDDHPNGRMLRSREEFKDAITGWVQAFPDAKLVDATYHDAGQTSVAQYVFEGTNKGPFGDHPATGRRVSIPACEIMHFDEQGLMRSGQGYYDLVSVLVQLGHMESPSE